MKRTINLLVLSFCVVLSGRAQIITTIAGNGNTSTGSMPNGDGGPAINAPMRAFTPCIDSYGIIYFADWAHNTIRKIDTLGVITTIAGTGGSVYNGENIPASSANISALAIAIDGVGNIFIAEDGRIRKIDKTTGLINTIAGTGIVGYSPDNASAILANIGIVTDIKVSPNGELHFVEQISVDSITVRKINGAGKLLTVAGGGPYSSNVFNGEGGPANAASITATGICFDKAGNLYIACLLCIKKVTTDGLIHTIVGGANPGTSGPGPALSIKVSDAVSIAIDFRGNLYFSEQTENWVRAVYTNGSTILYVNDQGINRRAGCSGDGGLSRDAETAYAWNVATDANDNLYLTDFVCGTIRKITTMPNLKVSKAAVAKPKLFPNPASNEVNLSFAQSFVGKIEIFNATGQRLCLVQVNNVINYSLPVAHYPNGFYCLKLTQENGLIQSIPFIK